MDRMDVRWLQRYDNFHKALANLTSVTESGRAAGSLSDLEKAGLVQYFEFTYELAWKTMQDLLEYKGYEFVKGPNGTLRMALADGLIADQDGWRSMAKARTLMSHTYDESDAANIVEAIYEVYSPLLVGLDDTFKNQKREAAL